MSKKDWQLLKAYQATGLTPEEVERVKRERDAAVADLKESRRYKCDCCYFANRRENNAPCRDCCSSISTFGDGWQWRGVREDKE